MSEVNKQFWEEERQDVQHRFTEMLSAATGDGSRKRQRNEKPPWFLDKSHHAAAMRHYARWLTDPKGRDDHSGQHHLVAAAWRLLAIAATESGNVPSSGCFAGLSGSVSKPKPGREVNPMMPY